jgi:hypothetical protein
MQPPHLSIAVPPVIQAWEGNSETSNTTQPAPIPKSIKTEKFKAALQAITLFKKGYEDGIQQYEHTNSDSMRSSTSTENTAHNLVAGLAGGASLVLLHQSITTSPYLSIALPFTLTPFVGVVGYLYGKASGMNSRNTQLTPKLQDAPSPICTTRHPSSVNLINNKVSP